MKFNLADVFETVADSVPERIALSFEGRQISYAELDRLSNQVAHLLADIQHAAKKTWGLEGRCRI